MSNSLFEEQVEKHFACFYGGSLIGLITDESNLPYNFKSIIDARSQERLKQGLFAIDTAEAKLLEENKWTK